MVRALVHSRLLDRLEASFFPSRATAEGNTPARTASGGESFAWATLAGLVDIPASVSPMIFTRAGERQTSQMTSSETTHRIALAGSFPQITAAMRLRITGTNAGVYDIIRPDRDSQGITTVLEAKLMTPLAETGV